MRTYRVWTKNMNGTLSIMTNDTTYRKCRRFIIGRWGHWPPFAFISSAQDSSAFRRYNGA
mgnify:CR=1